MNYKIYHIYDCKNEGKCEYATLSEDDFPKIWESLDKTRYEYVKCTVYNSDIQDASY